VTPNQLYFDAWDLQCKEPFGAVEAESFVTLRLAVNRSLIHKRIALVLRKEGSAARRLYFTKANVSSEKYLYTIKFQVNEAGLYFYRFEIETDKAVLFVGRDEQASAVLGDFLPEWQLTVYGKKYEAPCELQKGVMYQIFPDRFLRGSDKPLPLTHGKRTVHTVWGERPLCIFDDPKYEATDFFGGDLAGITEKLPYLHDLGVTIIYLNPIFESASNHRYNTGDYLKIDPYLGDESDFITLCSEAEKLGIRIILDGVFSHTGSDSVYFNKDGHYDSLGAYQSPDSPYAKWYTFKNKTRTDYECWWGFKTLPNVNETQADFIEFICGENGVLRYWLDRGAAGFRLDVADELPDEFLKKLRQCVKAEDPGNYILGEVWEDASIKCSYGVRRPYLMGEELDSVMNYPWRTAILDYMKTGNARPFYTSVMTILDHYPPQSIATLMTPLSTHDRPRALNELGVEHTVEDAKKGEYRLTEKEYGFGKELFKQAAVLQYTLPGFPSLYYGDEAGLTGFSDPWCRRCFPWGSEDTELTGYFKSLGQLRRVHAEEFTKHLCFVCIEEQAVAYTRGSILTAVNRSGKPVTLPLQADKVILFSGTAPCVSAKDITIPSYTAAVLHLAQK